MGLLKKEKAEEGFSSEKEDPELMRIIQPRGGITFKDECLIRTGNGYEACVHIYGYPSEVTDHWLGRLCNIQNTIALVDVSTADILEAKKNINRSMQEQNQRYRSATNFGEKYDAEARFREMEELYTSISSMGEVVKLIDVRIFLADYTKNGLEEKMKRVMQELEVDQYSATVYLNESKREWESMYRPYTEQQKETFPVPGQEIQSSALAGGNPFHFSSLSDEGGLYIGQTPCGGVVNLNLFAKTTRRLYYNGLVSGEMGSGKSTLLKKLFLDAAAVRGDFVRTFDITGEFEDLTIAMRGKYISPDGSDGVLNPLEILRASDNENMNYMMHLSKLSTIYRSLEPEADTEEVTTFIYLVRELYEERGLVVNGPGDVVTGRPSRDYPVFTDLVNFADKKIAEINNREYGKVELATAQRNALILDKIRKTLENVTFNYGALFDQHTSMDNIEDEKVVTFNLSALKEMSENIFDAVIYNYVSLCWENGVANGMRMKQLWEDGKIEWDDITHFLMIIDESHRWVNTKKMQALDQIVTYLREGRKYFCGLVMASQSIRDYMPGGRAESADAAVNKLKTLFELMQYKFLFRHDNSSVGILNEVFEGDLTQSQLERIPVLEQGETILNISGDSNLEFRVYLSPEEDRLFRGGA